MATKRRPSDHDHAQGNLRRQRSSGVRDGIVEVGHDKAGRHRIRDRQATSGSDMTERSDRYPNLSALRALEHAEHVRRAMQMGLTRSQAERHARRDEQDAKRREGDRFWAGLP